MIQNVSETTINDKIITEKQSLQSFILGVHTKAPIKFLNGDTWDNRKSNLEIHQSTDNDIIEINENTVALILRDKYGKESDRTLIDKEDLDRVKSGGYVWTYFRLKGKPHAVANTPEGRIFLNRIIMNTPDNSITHHINLNTLDNRKTNIENVVLDEA